MKNKKLGKINSITLGFGGHQGSMFGVDIDIGSDVGNWGCGHFVGGWGPEIKVDKGTKWTEDDRSNDYDRVMRYVAGLLIEAKKKDISELTDVPVEVTFKDSNTFESFRILKEVL